MRGATADGETIRRLRKAQALTQEDLAASVGCDVKTVRRAEHSRNVDLYTLGRVAAVLDVPFHEIVNGHDARASQQARLDVVHRYRRAFNERDSDAMLDCCHDDIVMRLPGAPDVPFAGEFRGKEEAARMHELVFASAQTEAITPENMSFFADGDVVFAYGVLEMASRASGDVAKLISTTLFRFDGLKIIELVSGYDSLEMSKVLNAPPADGAEG